MAQKHLDRKKAKQYALSTPVASHDQDAELDELATLIKSSELSESAIERMADLLGQTDRNKNKY